MKPTELGIVIVNWNRLPITIKSINSLIANTTEGYILTVVDNNTTDDFDNINGVEVKREKYKPSTLDYLNGLRQEGKIHHLLLNARNYGLGFGRNVGADILTSPMVWQRSDKVKFLLIADNDLNYPPGWLEEASLLWEELSVSHNLGAIMFSNCPEHFARQIIQNNGRTLFIKNPCAGNAILIPTSIFYELGKFPTDHDIGNEDWTLCKKLGEAGYNILNCPYLLEHIGKGHSLWLGPGK